MSKQLNRTLKATALASLLTLIMTGPARAVDGVIEINQARAKAGGVTPSDTPLFPVTIDKSGSYRLTSNLDVTDTTALPNGTAPKDATAIVIAADNVIIDLNGFGLIGPTVCTGTPPAEALTCAPKGSGTGVNAFTPTVRQGVAVVNGFVRGFGSDGLQGGNGCRIEGVHLSQNGDAGINNSRFCVIRNNVATSNGFVGLNNVSGTVSGNTVEANGVDGIFETSASVIEANRVRGNRGVGINAGVGGTVIGNSVSENADVGLSLSSATAYANNFVKSNKDGANNNQVTGGIQTGGNVCGTALCP